MQAATGSREVSWNAGTRRPSKSELLKRRVLSFAAYASELRLGTRPSKEDRIRRFGSTILPIPIPLCPSETLQQYAVQFDAWVFARNEDWSKIKANPNMERSLRTKFARERALEYDPTCVEPDHSSEATGTDTTKNAFWKALYSKRYVDLDTHQREYREGKFAKIKTMSRAEKIREFGSHIVPIFVPLACGETPEIYEGRFKEWLERERGMTYEDLVADDRAHERYERVQFAKANTTGHEQFIPQANPPRKRERSIQVEVDDDDDDKVPPPKKRAIFDRLGPASVTSEDDRSDTLSFSRGDDVGSITVPPSPMNKCSVMLPAEDSPIPELIAAYVACGCHQCMRNGLLSVSVALNKQSKTNENDLNKIKSKTELVVSPVDLTRDQCDSDAARNVRSAAAITKIVLSKPSFTELTISSMSKPKPARLTDDAVERQLFSDYDAINEQILANENVVDASAIEIASSRIVDIAGTTQLQDENEEMRDIIEEEVNNRNAALALVIVYVWRHAQVDLEGLIEDDRAGHVVHIQCTSHRKLATLAKQIVECWAQIDSLKSQLDTILTTEYDDDESTEAGRLAELSRVGELLTSSERDLQQLQDQRRRELMTLTHFDERIRLLVQTLLARVQ